MQQLRLIDRPGFEDYCSTLELQEHVLNERIDHREHPDTLILVEHDNVYTVGRGVEFQQPTKNIPWYEVARGGQATYHGPGQLVVYPIIDLEQHGKDVHLYLRMLEDVIIDCFRRLGLETERNSGITGVWTRPTDQDVLYKIASIGVGVRRWISWHGVALNIAPDLSYFREISPCGGNGQYVTSLQDCLKESADLPSLELVKQTFVQSFCEVFGFEQGAFVGSAYSTKPEWMKAKAPGSPEFAETHAIVKKLRLNTVCQEAICPNAGECWSNHTATFMIMGESCTRRCGFCSVKDGTVYNLKPLDALEPLRVAKAVQELDLRHAVLTSVDRDDLADMGADHFAACVRAIHHVSPECSVEVLIPDMQGKRELLARIVQQANVHILNHNLETVPRLYKEVRPGARVERSLNILKWAKELVPGIRTKTGIMLGLGETFEEVLDLMDELRAVSCDVLTIGQYLQPTPAQREVTRYVPPEEFKLLEEEGLNRGFLFVESGPFVRSSYHAWKHVSPQT